MQCGITAGKRDDGEQVIKPLLVQSYSATFFINYMSRSQDMAITSPTFAGSDPYIGRGRGGGCGGGGRVPCPLVPGG